MKFDNHWANLSHVDPGTFTRPAATCQICKDEHQIIQELVEYGAAAAILNPDLSGWHRAKHWGLQMEGSSAGVRTAPQWLHRAWYLAACKHGSSILQMASVKSKTNLPLQKKACCVYFLCTSLHTSSLNRTYIIIYTHKICPEASRYLQRGFLHLPSVLVSLRQIWRFAIAVFWFPQRLHIEWCSGDHLAHRCRKGTLLRDSMCKFVIVCLYSLQINA